MSFWSNCVLFGAVVGSVIGFLWNSVHSPENELLQQLIVCFSGLWQDLSLAACGIPSTAPKRSFWSNCVLFGAVVGSVKHMSYWLVAFGIPSTAPKASFWSNSLLLGAVAGSDKHVLYSLATFGISSAAPKTSFWSNSLLCVAMVGSDKHVFLFIGCFLNFVHSPDNELLEQFFAFRGCGKIWQARFVLIAMTADRTRSRTRTGPDPIRTRAPDPTRTGRTLIYGCVSKWRYPRISWISLKWIKFASWMGKLDEHGKKPSTLGVWGFIWLCRYLISKTSFDVLLSKAVAMVSSNLPMLLIAVPGRHTCLQTHPFSLDLGSLKHSTSQTNRTVTYPKSCCYTKCYK